MESKYILPLLVIWITGNRRRLVTLIPKADSFVMGLPKKWVMPPLVVMAVLVWVTAATMPDDNLHVNFLDVGQGDAVLIQKGSQQVLVDGGPSPQALTLALGKEMPFWDRTIDLVVLTHPHTDHLTGLVEVLSRYRVLRVLDADLEYESPLYDKWRSLIDEKNIETVSAVAG
ncbi:MBL fold metallo-hydrolase [Chloroflexota bacterium]